MSHAFSAIHRAKENAGARSNRAPDRVVQRQAVSNTPEPSGCACGGGCPRCAATSILQTKAMDGVIDGVIQRDFEPHPEHTEEEIFAAMGSQDAETEKTPEEEEEEAPADTGDMGGMQMKLVVGSQDDPSEREADQAADAIVAGSPAPPIAGKAESGAISRSAMQDSGVKPAPALTSYLADPGAGSPLPDDTRSQIEQGLGADFGHVRLHTDARAQEAAASVGARAFTLGSNIWVGKNESSSDTRLIAHELTHVVQQGHAGPATGPSAPAQIQRKIITSPKKLVDFIEGAAHKTETRTDPVSSATGPAHVNLLAHERWHVVDHPDPNDPAGADINDPFGAAFMDFHHAMMNGFKAAGGSSTTWGATTAPPTGENFDIFKDPAKLAKIKTANNLGNLIVGPHNGSHMFFSAADPEDAGMGDFYWAPRHDVFYKLHLWIDDRYMDWKKATAPKKAKTP